MAWPSRQLLKAGALGAAGMLVLVLLAVSVLAGWIVWTRARNGEWAYEYVQRVIEQQQQQHAPPAAK